MKLKRYLNAFVGGMVAFTALSSLVWAYDFELPPVQVQTQPSLGELQNKVCGSVRNLIANKILTLTQDGQADIAVICNSSSDLTRLGDAARRVYEGMSQVYNITGTSEKVDKQIYAAMNDDEALANYLFKNSNGGSAQ